MEGAGVHEQNNESEKTLEVIEAMMNFTLQVYRDIRQGKDTNIYSDAEPALSYSFKYVIKQSVLCLNATFKLGEHKPILDLPNRSEILQAHLTKIFTDYRIWLSNLNFIEWCVACCVLNVELYEQGFIEAPSIAIDVMHEICLADHRSEIFSFLG